MSNRTIRPLGPVTETLREAGYREYAAIFIDGKQVEKAAILSLHDNQKIKYVGMWFDANGEVVQTYPHLDMKHCAKTLLKLIDSKQDKSAVSEPAAAGKITASQAEAAVKQPDKATKRADAKRTRKAPRRKPERAATNEVNATLIDCKACGCVHRDDVMCL